MNIAISPQDAATELLRRRRARSSLVAYSNAIDVPGRPTSEDEDEWLFHPIETSVAAHHILMLETAEKIITMPHGRGIFLFPPGSAKSTYLSVVVPTYCMGRWPDYRIVAASYGSDLSRKFGRRGRQIVRSPAYQSLFGTELSSESSAADEWALTNGSEYMSGGILSGITGNRAKGVVIDDPVKGRDEAESPQIRKRTREAYEDDIKTRILPGAWIILIQTRWHQDDLAGSILPEGWNGESGLIRCRDGMDWYVLCVPAKAERQDDPLGRKVGEYLWPQWFTRQHWAQFESNARTWSALYQQRPTPSTGSYFLADWLRPYEKLPSLETLHIYGASDYAVTKDGGDYTVHGVVGIDSDDGMWLLDLWRAQTTSDQWVDAFCDLVKRWKPIGWAEEQGQINAGVGPFLEKRMRERKAYVARVQFPTRHDKAVRAQSIRGRMAQLGLHVPILAPWYPEFQSELLSFDAGKHDDQVDMLGLIGQILDRMSAGKAEKDPDGPIRGADKMTMDEAWQASLVNRTEKRI